MTTRLYRHGKCVEAPDRSLPLWRLQALTEGFRHLYKGYKLIDGNKIHVVIMTDVSWGEITRMSWQERGMKNIRHYDLFGDRMHTRS
jgi:hypothetical protein